MNALPPLVHNLKKKTQIDIVLILQYASQQQTKKESIILLRIKGEPELLNDSKILRNFWIQASISFSSLNKWLMLRNF